MRKYCYILLVLLICSCSPNLLEPTIHQESSKITTGLSTKSYDISGCIQPNKMISAIQTNHLVILLNHILSKDGCYYLSLNQQELEELNISTQEQELINCHIAVLNKQNK